MKPFPPATKEEIQAIIDEESDGEMYFDSYMNAQYRANMRIVRNHIPDEVQCNEALKLLRKVDITRGGLEQVVIAKFRFSLARWEEVNKDLTFKNWNIHNRFLLSCSVGLAQKIIMYLYKESINLGRHPVNALEVCHLFVHDKDMQTKQCEKDLNYWLGRAKGNRLLAYSCYNAGMVDKPNGYGYNIQDKVKELKDGKH